MERPLEAQKVEGATTEAMSPAPPALGWCGAPARPSDVTLAMSGEVSRPAGSELASSHACLLILGVHPQRQAEVGVGGGMMGLRHCCQTHLGEGEKKQDTQT